MPENHFSRGFSASILHAKTVNVDPLFFFINVVFGIKHCKLNCEKDMPPILHMKNSLITLKSNIQPALQTGGAIDCLLYLP